MARRRVPGVRRRPGPAALLLSRPWVRAPLAAAAQPGASAAVLVATAILGIAAATAPLFLSAAATGALHRVVETCPQLYQPTVTNQAAEGSGYALPDPATDYGAVEDREVRRVLAGRGMEVAERVLVVRDPDTPELDPTDTAETPGTVDPPLAVRAAGRPPQVVTVFSAPSALSRVEILRGERGGRGLWLPSRLAERLGVKEGDRVALRGRPVPVAGVYRSLDDPAYAGDLPLSWCRWSALILPRIGDGGPPVVPLVLADPQTALEAARFDRPWSTWFTTLDPATARAGEATATAARLAGAGTEIEDARGVVGVYEEQLTLREATDRAAGVRSALADATRPAALAATLVALLLVAAAGGYWAERRAGEVRLLASRGIGPPGLAGKAVLEMIVPALAGAALGWAVTLAAAPRLGPSPLLDDGAGRQALSTVVLALLAGLVALGTVAGLRGRATGERPVGLGRSRWRLVPWELALVALGGWAYLRLRDGPAVTSADEVVQVDPLVVAVPLLLLPGLAVLAVRLLGLPAARLQRTADRLPVPGYLAARRLAAARAVTAVVVVAVAVPVGVLVTCAGLTASVQDSVQAKTRTYVGAPVALRTDAPPGATPDTGGRGTPVSLLAEGTVGGSTELPVLGVDPATFARYAYWRDGFAGDPLPELLARLARPGPDGRVPAVLAGARRDTDVRSVGLRSTVLEVEVVGRAAAFPGMRAVASPLLVVDRRLLAGVDPYSQRTEEVWTSAADAGAAAQAVGRSGTEVVSRLEEGAVLRVTDLYPLTWTFGYVQVLAGLAGIISVTALLLYLAVRQRSRTAAYALSRRMGLTRRRHVGSLLTELLLAVGLGAAAGVGLAVLVLGPVLDLMEIDPGRRPAGVGLVLPAPALLGVLGGTAVLVVLGALLTQAVADRARPADVLRGER